MSTLARFRPATDRDAGWLAGRLPADRLRGMNFIGEQFGIPVAAFAVAPPIERYAPEGLALAFSVEPSPEARAVAMQIVELAAAMAGRASLGPLHAWLPQLEGSPGERAYRALGFAPFDRIVTWHCDAAAARDTLAPLLDAARAWAPDDPCWQASDVALAQADVDEVVAFYDSHLARLGPTRDAFARRLRGEGVDAFHPVRSRALVLDGELVGLILMIFDPALTCVAARIVAPSLRDGPATLRLIIDASSAAGIPPGCQLRFETHDRHRGTASLARRLRASKIQTLVKMRRDA